MKSPAHASAEDHALTVRLAVARAAASEAAAVLLGGYDERRLKPWDVMAGVAIVREAGGQAADLDGGADSEHDDIACSNSYHHADLHALILGRAL